MIDNKVYEFFASYIKKSIGIEYSEKEYFRLDSRINTLIKSFQLADANELYDKLKFSIDDKTHDLLIDLFTNNETYFMRDLKPFKAIARGVVPELLEKQSFGNLKIWSCASSTGQEIYSILMAIDSFGSKENLARVQIDASDISDEALAKAKKGEYTELDVQRGLPAPFLIKYFEKDEETSLWKVSANLKAKANFFKFNLLEESFPVNQYHIIFCRNVLIYQNQQNKQKILEKIYDSLKPGGYLVFGAGESLIGLDINLKQVEVEKAWFYKKES